MIEISEKKEKFVLIGVSVGDTYKNGKILKDDTAESIEELKELVRTAGGETVGVMIQNREQIDKGTYFGTGKVLELKELIEAMGATGIVCDDELTPSQISGLEEALDVKICDRTQIILDIFAQHAVTAEGKIRVELAQLEYRRSHLIGTGRAFTRQGGGIGTRGPGEKKLETDRRLIKDKIAELNREIKKITVNRETTRAKRKKASVPTAAIVGYTNAGKSTLLNKITDAGVLEEDMLFATLDPVVRETVLSDGQKILLTDTVGFVRKLPHNLVDAFRSTLEEAKYADIIIQVVDGANTDYQKHMEVTYDTLNDLNVTGKTFITFFNKCDLEPHDDTRFRDARADYVITGSALTGDGIPELKRILDKVIKEKRNYIERKFSFDEIAEIQKIRRFGQVISEEYTEDGVYIKAYVDKRQ